MRRASAGDAAPNPGSAARTPDPEAKTIRAITTRLPPVVGLGAVANVLKRWYLRKPRPPMRVEAHGFRWQLDPQEFIERELIFTPQLYDRPLLQAMRRAAAPGDVFVDIGANVGVFSLVASRLVGEQGRVLAFEPDRHTMEKLQRHIEMNGASNVVAFPAALSDTPRTAWLTHGLAGNRGTSSLTEVPGREGEEVVVMTLPDALAQAGCSRIDLVKADAEGHEYHALLPIFQELAEEAWPRMVLLEEHRNREGKPETGALALLESKGYRVTWTEGADHILERDPTG